MLFVRNLANGVTEETLEKSFSQFGKLERVKKLKDYAFIHFEERDGAVKVGTPHITRCGRGLCSTIITCGPSSGAGGDERQRAGGRAD